MTLFQAVISGIVQGVTEFLPISSSGHLVILHRLFGIKEPQVVFDIFLHLGTLTAIFIVFRKDILDIFTTKKRIGLFILIGTLSTAIFVLPFGKRIEDAFGNVRFVGAMLLVTGIWLIFANFVRFGKGYISGTKASLIGFVQGIATLPGISRSGVTISMGLFLGLDAQSSAKFSFLLSIPATIGAFLLKMHRSDNLLSGFSGVYLLGFTISCIVGIISLRLLLKILYRNRLHLFGIYCIFAGMFVFLFL